MNSIKMFLLILVIGGVSLTGVYYFLPGKKGTDYNPAAKPSVENNQLGPTAKVEPVAVEPETKNKVTLSAGGFSPKVLTIKAWDTVTWENKGGGAATVDSDSHPSHTKYPPLNLGKFDNGTTLSLMFDQPGTYGYHNHLNPIQSGTIIVE